MIQHYFEQTIIIWTCWLYWQQCALFIICFVKYCAIRWHHKPKRLQVFSKLLSRLIQIPGEDTVRYCPARTGFEINRSIALSIVPLHWAVNLHRSIRMSINWMTTTQMSRVKWNKPNDNAAEMPEIKLISILWQRHQYPGLNWYKSHDNDTHDSC